MTVPGKRQISDAEKQEVLKRQGLRCFIDNHPVADAADLEYDHIQPYTEGGPSTTANIAAVCKKHNREKGALSLSEYRDRLDLRAFLRGRVQTAAGRSSHGEVGQWGIRPGSFVGA